jgi:hypothetical protein
MSEIYRLNRRDSAEQETPFTGAFTRREMIKRGVMAGAAAAMFGGSVRNLGAQDASSIAQLLKPGTKLSALRGVPGADSSSREVSLRRDPSERYLMRSSRDLDPKIAKALGDPFMIVAMLQRIDPQDKLIKGGSEFEAFIVPVNLFGAKDSGGFFVIVHDHFPPPLTQID